jgi:glycosyltransferase involved in cell wall biosynthesis
LRRPVVFDISTLARTPGPASGIVRVMRELARWAHANRPDTTFVMFDTQTGAFRAVQPQYFHEILEGRAVIDLSQQSARNGEGERFIDRLSPPLRRGALWLRNPRRRLLMALERMRLAHPERAPWIERMQAALLQPRHRAELFDAGGRRIALLPYDLAVGPVVSLDSQLVLCAGSDWSPAPIALVGRRKQEAELRFAFICYDMIPLLHPEFFGERNAGNFRTMFHSAIPLADLVLVTARKIAEDFESYCVGHGLPVPRLRSFHLGSDLPPRRTADAPLPQGLSPGSYALFVSTLEPRKGHALLFSVWKRLLAQGIPQAAGFKLVFVGRRGWLVDDLMAEIEAHPSYGDSLLMLSGIDDDQLATLYRHAAFGLFPSLYEGYGLPVVEAFQYGKAMLASTGGALPEVVDGLSPCLDPLDEDAWFETMRLWITDPAIRAPYEAAIRERFSHPTWPDAAKAFFTILDGQASEPAPMRERLG